MTERDILVSLAMSEMVAGANVSVVDTLVTLGRDDILKEAKEIALMEKEDLLGDDEADLTGNPFPLEDPEADDIDEHDAGDFEADS